MWSASAWSGSAWWGSTHWHPRVETHASGSASLDPRIGIHASRSTLFAESLHNLELLCKFLPGDNAVTAGIKHHDRVLMAGGEGVGESGKGWEKMGEGEEGWGEWRRRG